MIRHNSIIASLKCGQFRILLNEFLHRLWSTAKWYGFERDLSSSLGPGTPRIKVHIRELQKDDIPVLLNLAEAKDSKAFKDRLIRLSMVKADIPTCYVAVTSDGIPCNMQWMFGSDANDKIQPFTCGGLPVLKENEVLLENAFTPERYRRQGIDLEALRFLFKLARGKGMKRAILFVSNQNLISLKMVSKLGFTPFCLKTCRWRLFRPHFTFKQIHEKTAQKQIQSKLYQFHSGSTEPDKQV